MPFLVDRQGPTDRDSADLTHEHRHAVHDLLFGADDRRRKWWILAAAGATLSVILIDETVIGVALPSIREDLGMTEVGSHWVVTSYLLVLAGFVAVGGKLGDIVGLKRVYLLGALLFGVASLAAGFAPDPGWLVAARALQALGAALILPASMALVTTTFPAEQRGLALGIYIACGGLGITLGPLVGGALTEALSWRWIFFVNPPIVAAIIAVVVVAVHDPVREGSRPAIDVRGLVALVVGLSALVLGIMQGSTWGWDAPATLLALVVGIASLVAFRYVELHRTEPLIEVRLFRNGTFSGSNLAIFTAQFAKAATIVYLPLYLQDVLDLSALEAGLVLLPAGLMSFVAAIFAGHLVDRTGPRGPTLAGLAGVGLALGWLSIASTQDEVWQLMPALALWGASLPFMFAPPQAAIMGAVPSSMQGQTGGITRTSQMVGGAIGIAVYSALLTAGASYATLFLSGAGLCFAVLALDWVLIREKDELAPK